MTCGIADTQEDESVVLLGQGQGLAIPELPRDRILAVAMYLCRPNWSVRGLIWEGNGDLKSLLELFDVHKDFYSRQADSLATAPRHWHRRAPPLPGYSQRDDPNLREAHTGIQSLAGTN